MSRSLMIMLMSAYARKFNSLDTLDEQKDFVGKALFEDEKHKGIIPHIKKMGSASLEGRFENEIRLLIPFNLEEGYNSLLFLNGFLKRSVATPPERVWDNCFEFMQSMSEFRYYPLLSDEVLKSEGTASVAEWDEIFPNQLVHEGKPLLKGIVKFKVKEFEESEEAEEA